MSVSQPVRVRFAPSPTGPLHIGGVRTALYNWLFARRHGGQFLLRIEDTDQKRYVPAAEAYILEALAWLGMTPDEGPEQGGPHAPYRQSERKALYTEAAQALLNGGHAYWAFDTEAELDAWRAKAEADGNPPPKYDAAQRMQLRNALSLPPEETERLLAEGAPKVLRLKVPEDQTIAFTDVVRGEVAFNSSEVDDKVLLKADGLPTYHLANVVDDHAMGITHVIRGEEWLSSCPLHMLLYGAFGWDAPVFAHLPLILNPNGKGKLSKRTADKLGFPVFPLDWQDPESGAVWPGFREFGFERAAVLNILAFLGWNPGTEQEIFSAEALVQAFDLERVGKAGARFDFEKAVWFNQEHLKLRSDADVGKELQALLASEGQSMDLEICSAVAGMLKERVAFVREMPQKGHYFFGPVQALDEKTLRKKYKPERREAFDRLAQRLEGLADFSAESVEAEVKAFMEEEELGFGAVLPVLRLAMAGSTQGPPAFDMMATLGKATVVGRFREALDRFDALVQTA
jgi:glutamyl-tRNA synthetase